MLPCLECGADVNDADCVHCKDCEVAVAAAEHEEMFDLERQINIMHDFRSVHGLVPCLKPANEPITDAEYDSLAYDDSNERFV